eukprot:PhM_4_TR12960/c0_g1_i2/m.9170
MINQSSSSLLNTTVGSSNGARVRLPCATYRVHGSCSKGLACNLDHSRTASRHSSPTSSPRLSPNLSMIHPTTTTMQQPITVSPVVYPGYGSPEVGEADDDRPADSICLPVPVNAQVTACTSSSTSAMSVNNSVAVFDGLSRVFAEARETMKQVESLLQTRNNNNHTTTSNINNESTAVMKTPPQQHQSATSRRPPLPMSSPIPSPRLSSKPKQQRSPSEARTVGSSAAVGCWAVHHNASIHNDNNNNPSTHFLLTKNSAEWMASVPLRVMSTEVCPVLEDVSPLAWFADMICKYNVDARIEVGQSRHTHDFINRYASLQHHQVVWISSRPELHQNKKDMAHRCVSLHQVASVVSLTAPVWLVWSDTEEVVTVDDIHTMDGVLKRVHPESRLVVISTGPSAAEHLLCAAPMLRPGAFATMLNTHRVARHPRVDIISTTEDTDRLVAISTLPLRYPTLRRFCVVVAEYSDAVRLRDRLGATCARFGVHITVGPQPFASPSQSRRSVSPDQQQQHYDSTSDNDTAGQLKQVAHDFLHIPPTIHVLSFDDIHVGLHIDADVLVVWSVPLSVSANVSYSEFGGVNDTMIMCDEALDEVLSVVDRCRDGLRHGAARLVIFFDEGGREDERRESRMVATVLRSLSAPVPAWLSKKEREKTAKII